MNRTLLACCLSAILCLTACSPTPEEAQKKLAEKQIPVNADSLMAQTKTAKGEDAAKLLVIAGADVNARQANGMTALMSAVFNGQTDVVKALIDKGADVNATAKGFTALRLAVERNNKDMVKLLLAHGAKPALTSDGAPSALEKAKEMNLKDLADLMEEKAK
jgi:ankyrin repeat protein